MGIHNLNKFLRKKCPHVFKEIHISNFAYKKVAIDITLFLCKFKSICGDKWVSAFINLVASLRRNEIHCVFIFYNGAPDEKTTERQQRRKQQEIMRQKIFDLEISLEKYRQNKEIDPILREIYDKLTPDEKPRASLLSGKQNVFNIESVEKKVNKMKNYILNICEDDFTLTKKLFDILNVPYYYAPLEAECTCADLCKRGIVDAVLTEDTDVLAYGSPIFLSKIDTGKDTCVQINYNEVLESLNINSSQFLDLCIMFGCDYNKNINKVGIETSFKYISTYGSIDEIEKNLGIDVSVLNHKRSRELFTEYKKIDISSVPFCGPPNFDYLKKFILKHNLIGLNFEKIRSHFIDARFKIIHENDEENNNSTSVLDEKNEDELLSKEEDIVVISNEKVDENKVDDDEYDFEIIIEEDDDE